MVTHRALRRPAIATAGKGTAVRPPFWNARHLAEFGIGILAVAAAVIAALIIAGSSGRAGGETDLSWEAIAAIQYPHLSPAAAAEAARWTALAEFTASADVHPVADLSNWEALAAIRYPDLSPVAAAEAARWTALARYFSAPADATPGPGPKAPGAG